MSDDSMAVNQHVYGLDLGADTNAVAVLRLDDLRHATAVHISETRETWHEFSNRLRALHSQYPMYCAVMSTNGVGLAVVEMLQTIGYPVRPLTLTAKLCGDLLRDYVEGIHRLQVTAPMKALYSVPRDMPIEQSNIGMAVMMAWRGVLSLTRPNIDFA